MREIVRESEISMLTRENSLSNQTNDDVVIDRGGVLFSESLFVRHLSEVTTKWSEIPKTE